MYLIWELFPPLEDEKLNPESTHNVLDPVSIENDVFHLISDFPGSTLRRPPCKQKNFLQNPLGGRDLDMGIDFVPLRTKN